MAGAAYPGDSLGRLHYSPCSLFIPHKPVDFLPILGQQRVDVTKIERPDSRMQRIPGVDMAGCIGPLPTTPRQYLVGSVPLRIVACIQAIGKVEKHAESTVFCEPDTPMHLLQCHRHRLKRFH